MVFILKKLGKKIRILSKTIITIRVFYKYKNKNWLKY